MPAWAAGWSARVNDSMLAPSRQPHNGQCRAPHLASQLVLLWWGSVAVSFGAFLVVLQASHTQVQCYKLA